MQWASRWSPLLGVFERERARLARRLAQQGEDNELLAASLRAEFVEVPRSLLHRRLQGVAERLTFALEDGASLPEAMKEHPGDFAAWEIALVKAAERSDDRRRAMGAWATRLSNGAETKDALSNVLLYPISLALVAFGASVLLLSTLIPTMASLFTSMYQELPLPTRLWIAAANVLADAVPVLVLGGLVVATLSAIAVSGKDGLLKVSRLRYRAPWFGRAALSADRAVVLELLRGLAAGGLPPHEALALTGRSLGSRAGQQELTELATTLRRGGSIDDDAPGLLLDGSTRRALARAWSAADPAQVLDGLARSEETRSRRAAARGLAFIEPISVAVLGLVLAFGMIAAMLPLYEINARLESSLP